MSKERLEAYKIIYSVLKKNQFSSKLLTQAKNRLQNNGEDSDLLYTLVKGTIKMYKQLDYIAVQLTEPQKYKATDFKIKILLYMGIYQLRYLTGMKEYAAINETVETARALFDEKVVKFVNGVLRSYQREPNISFPSDTVSRIAVEYSFPEEMVRDFISIYGAEQTEYAYLYFNDKPKLKVRLNGMATTVDKFISYFGRRNIEFKKIVVSGNFLETGSGDRALHDVAFEEGYFSVQDPAAGLVVELLQPLLDMNIIDMFAAPGGKACYMAELMQGTGEVIAIDKMPGKCKLIKQNCQRLKLDKVQVIAEDAFKYGPIAPAYDKVLLDVPCSGWGVMQKKAELRWQQNQDIPQLLKLQEMALKTGAQFVCPGGDLVYSTCTLNPLENEKQVERFLSKNPAFELVPADMIISPEFTENGYLKTTPWKHNIDGAFAARMRRKT
ncbi:MAG: 16S rRNA (cytosine(967)-C(5))-methyltransferase RsmB [Candidatus Cloacimonetes bacterium]|nr:16S rRNA (cytosine(967)-C(5))-methyltransferase RsmB [Candidatus Cloacimonadota bacterium]